jgi:hypothetical protein
MASIDQIDIATAVLDKPEDLASELKRKSCCKDTTLVELGLCLDAIKRQLKGAEIKMLELGRVASLMTKEEPIAYKDTSRLNGFKVGLHYLEKSLEQFKPGRDWGKQRLDSLTGIDHLEAEALRDALNDQKLSPLYPLNDYYPMGIKDAIMTVQQPYREAIREALDTLKPVTERPSAFGKIFRYTEGFQEPEDHGSVYLEGVNIQ